MINTPSETEIDNLLCKHWPAYSMQAVLVKMRLRDAIKSAIAQWATPQPSPAAQGDAQDAARLDWLTFHLSGKALRDIGVVWSEHGDARRAIDAARAAQEGASHEQ